MVLYTSLAAGSYSGRKVPLRPMWAAAGDPVSNSNRALLKLVLSDCLSPLTARMLLGSL